MVNKRLTSSVALCTYNGSAYVRSQLDCLTAQTVLPDEVVICDDVSSDSTLSIVEDFAREAPFPVRIHRNERNLRSNANFQQAVSLCQNDVIFLCDQDDWWKNHKIDRIMSQFEANPEVGLVFSNAQIVDDHRKSLGYRAWESIAFTPPAPGDAAKLDLFPHLVSRYVVTGATMAFRREFLPLLIPFSDKWVHDAWISIIISAVAPAIAIDEDLIDYRIHANQQIGLPKPLRLGNYTLNAMAGALTQSITSRGLTTTLSNLMGQTSEIKRRYLDVSQHIRRLVANAGASLPNCGPAAVEAKLVQVAEKQAMLDELIIHLQNRLKLRSSVFHVRDVWNELRSGRYHRYGLGYLTAFRDAIRV